MMNHKIEFNIGQSVYVKTDIQQRERIITGIILRPFNSVTYLATLDELESALYGFELSKEKDFIMATQ